MEALMTSISQNLQKKADKERKSLTLQRSKDPLLAGPMHKTVSFERGTKKGDAEAKWRSLDFDKFYGLFMEIYGNKGFVDKVMKGPVKETVIKLKESLKAIDLTDVKGRA